MCQINAPTPPPRLLMFRFFPNPPSPELIWIPPPSTLRLLIFRHQTSGAGVFLFSFFCVCDDFVRWVISNSLNVVYSIITAFPSVHLPILLFSNYCSFIVNLFTFYYKKWETVRTLSCMKDERETAGNTKVC